ncbi:GNAT family N-acetyltransferase [Actinocrispum sp. NPDC049592]|uniref:GNAT family N-acetyltransferase n=1 Tax=Actinocrispum sp. NPDC049592 TaxID=3154835 RepID=UPI003448495B
MVGVAECERVQANWFVARARACGGSVWTDGGMLWTDGPDGVNVLFPSRLDLQALHRGVQRAQDLGRSPVGAWLGLAVDPGPLAAAGFERGWSPWWMTADLADIPETHDPRVRLETDTTDYTGEFADYRDQLALAREQPTRAWYAAAHLPDGAFAGRAWSFLDGDLAGVFDMNVWPPFQRRGLGTALLSAICAAAHKAGAHHAVLNATPDGKHLYRTRGFTQIGEGITWWRHLP